eukprot:gene9324-9489_t
MQLPPDLPAECPFASDWHAAVFAVQAADGINLTAIKDAFRQLQVLQHMSLADLVSRLDPADPLTAELAAAEATAGNASSAGSTADNAVASMPANLASKLLQQRFQKDRELSWKLELVKRRDALAKAEQEAQAAQQALLDATAALATATAKLAAVKASWPKPESVQAAVQLQQQLSSAGATDEGASSLMLDPDQQPLLQHQQEEELQLSPEQKRSLAEAEAGLAAAHTKASTLDAAVASTDAALAAAQEALMRPFSHYEPYWLEGLGLSASAVTAGIAAGIPLRAVVFLHCNVGSLPVTPGGPAGTRGSPSARPEKAAAVAPPVLQTAAPAAQPEVVLPQELFQLQDAVTAAAWDSPLAKLIVLPIAVGDVASPFTRVPQKRALLTVRDQAQLYDQWRAAVRVYRMPRPATGSRLCRAAGNGGGGGATGMSYYQHLLRHVPLECQSVPVVLHALLEQVCRNCVGVADMEDALDSELEQKSAMASAQEAIGTAFRQLVADDNDKLLSQSQPQPAELNVLYEGDDIAAAAHGLTTAKGISGQEAQAVELHMLQLMHLPAEVNNSDTYNSKNEHDQAELRRRLQVSELKSLCNGVPVAAVQRYQLLQAALAMLPAGVQAAHAEELLSRHHIQEMQPDVLRQVLSKASIQYPDAAWSRFEPSDSTLVAFYAGDQVTREHHLAIPHAQTFQRYWQQLLANGCLQPELQLQVYEMTAEAASHAWQQQLLYTDSGCIISTGTQEHLTVSQGPSTLRFMTDPAAADDDSNTPFQLVATLDDGAVASVFTAFVSKPASTAAAPMLTSSGTSGAAADSASSNGAPTNSGASSGAGDGTTQGDTYSNSGQPCAAAAKQVEVWPAAASATAAAIRVCTPQGLVVEMCTSGHVLLAPACPGDIKEMQASGVEVPGAPVAAGTLHPCVPSGSFSWRALLPSGALVKAVSAPHGPAAQHCPADQHPVSVAASSAGIPPLAADLLCGRNSMTQHALLTILHTDGSMSTQQGGVLEFAAGSTSAAAGWLRTSRKDPDTRAVVVTREDHLLVVDYPDGSRLLQDSEGCRLSFVNETWRFEAAGMPAITGNAQGVSVEPCPGVVLRWSAVTRCVTLQHLRSGATIYCTPCGRVAAGRQLQDPLLELFCDLAMPQSRQHPTATGSDERHGDVCAQEECWGLLGFDLCSGEAELWEAGSCRLQLTPDNKTGAGSEVLHPELAKHCIAGATNAATDAATPAISSLQDVSCCYYQQPIRNAEEPGTSCHRLVTTYKYKSPQLQPLQLSDPAVTVPFTPGGTSSLTCLRRADVFVPAELKAALGLKLPRVTALNPGYVCSAAASAGTSSREPTSASTQATSLCLVGAMNKSLPATRVDGDSRLAVVGAGSAANITDNSRAAGQVLVVRELLELPQLTTELQAQADSILKSYQAYQADLEARVAGRRPPECHQSQQLQQDAAEGPFDHCPQRPLPGQTLKYFECQEGLLAINADPLLRPGTKITRHDLPAAKAVQPASAAGAEANAGITASGLGPRAASAAASGGLSASGKSQAFDVYGQPRLVKPQLPAAHSKSQAAAELNMDYLAREAATMRPAKTSSAALIKASGRTGKQMHVTYPKRKHVVLSPAHIHFGTVSVGSVSHRLARLLNCSADVVRFTVSRPELPLRVLYKPVPLPAGMEATITVELVAEAAGDFVGRVTVKTEVNVIELTVSAKVVPAAAENPQVAFGHVSVADSAADGCTVYATARALGSMVGLEQHGCTLLQLDVCNGAQRSSVVRQVNFTAVVAMTQLVAPYMIQQRNGTIVNIGSSSGYVYLPQASAYSASKAALRFYTDALRVELAPFGVHVMHTALGFTRTQLFANMSPKVYQQPDSPYREFPLAQHELFRNDVQTGVGAIAPSDPAAVAAGIVRQILRRKQPPRPFVKHDLITEYCGPLIDHEKACKLRRQGKHTHVRVLNSQWLYINGLKEPTPGAGGASFANDARDSTVNNAAFIQKFDYKLGRDRVFIKACRDIDAGEEVFVSYGSTYWQNSRTPAKSAVASQHNEQCQRLSRYLDMQEPMVQQQRHVQSRQQTSEPSSIHSSQTDIDLPELAPPADLHCRDSRTQKSGCVGSQVCSNTHSIASSEQQLPPPGDAALAASRVVNFMSGGLRQAVGNAAAAVGGAAIAVASRVRVARRAARLC